MRGIYRVLIVLLSLALAMGVYLRLFGTPLVDAIARWTAFSTGGTLKLLGASVSTTGTVVGSSDLAFNIVTECTAIGPVLLFVGAVLAYPASLRSKLVGITIGTAFITALNLVRLVSLFYIGALFPRYLPTAHYLVWQAAIIIFTILIWLFWVERFTKASYE